MGDVWAGNPGILFLFSSIFALPEDRSFVRVSKSNRRIEPLRWLPEVLLLLIRRTSVMALTVKLAPFQAPNQSEPQDSDR